MHRLLLIRHCESAGQQPEAALTETGVRQAEALAGFLSRFAIDRVAASPYRRARESIAPFATAAGLPVHADDRLVEQRLAAGPVEHWREAVRTSCGDPDFRLPGGESAGEVLDRGWPALEGLLEGGHRLPVAVTHGKFLSVVLNAVGRDFGYAQWQSLSNPDVFALRDDGGGGLTYERVWPGGQAERRAGAS
ncbi:MAG: histidine phosphatase family protein [Gammaproteobacteria bacterium]|nr:histidine phosphatase family protein [Gammaproteobacteria bacterium]